LLPSHQRQNNEYLLIACPMRKENKRKNLAHFLYPYPSTFFTVALEMLLFAKSGLFLAGPAGI